uniref:Uncharacterized protein n=1 Tax=Ciona savignyi TaxID=51511 RepID=H2ZCQ3_CIOSA
MSKSDMAKLKIKKWLLLDTADLARSFLYF